jgi:hypothetical protein
LNLANREGKGSVQPEQAELFIRRLRDDLSCWIGPNGEPVVQSVWQRDEIFHGPYAAYAPDLIVGYAPGYRGSAQTGLGQWRASAIEANPDHWGADHCIAAEAVPGVLFARQDLANFPHPSFRDIPPLAMGVMPESNNDTIAPPPSTSHEDQDVVAERLKSLGYL